MPTRPLTEQERQDVARTRKAALKVGAIGGAGIGAAGGLASGLLANRIARDTMRGPGAFSGSTRGAFPAPQLNKRGLAALTVGQALGTGAVGAGLGLAGGHIAGRMAVKAKRKEQESKNLSSIPTKRLVQFSANLDKKLAQSGLVEFARPQEEEKPSLLSKVGKVAAVGALGAGAIGAGLYARGRMAAGKGAPNVGLIPTIKGGAGAIKGDVTDAYGKVKKAFARGK